MSTSPAGAISSKLIPAARPRPETIAELRKRGGLSTDVQICLLVLELAYNGNVYYCCLSGGELVNGEPHMTLVGRAAIEALANLPTVNSTDLIIMELKIGRTSIQEKIERALTQLPPFSKICFLGDMSGDLDGVILPILGLCPS